MQMFPAGGDRRLSKVPTTTESLWCSFRKLPCFSLFDRERVPWLVVLRKQSAFGAVEVRRPVPTFAARTIFRYSLNSSSLAVRASPTRIGYRSVSLFVGVHFIRADYLVRTLNRRLVMCCPKPISMLSSAFAGQ